MLVFGVGLEIRARGVSTPRTSDLLLSQSRPWRLLRGLDQRRGPTAMGSANLWVSSKDSLTQACRTASPTPLLDKIKGAVFPYERLFASQNYSYNARE